MTQTDLQNPKSGVEALTQMTISSLHDTLSSRRHSRDLNDYDGEPVRYTVSIGVASFYPDETFLQATMRADNRLYEAKKTSRNRVVGV